MVPPAFRFPGDDIPREPASACGADTDAVLREIGYDDTRIAALRAAKVV
jgi:crotonobetainyl-CoA:carnitine CoA-transferase CaiB-like acyl-CoA transferase